MCSEFYTGWLTHWGDATAANTSTAQAPGNPPKSPPPAAKKATCPSLNNPCRFQVAKDLDAILSTSYGSVSLYMAHGGTSFGWWSGVNGGGGCNI